MGVAFETVIEFRAFLSVYEPTLQNFQDFYYSNSSGSSDYQSELLVFMSTLSLEDLQVLKIYLHIGGMLVSESIKVSSFSEEELFSLILKSVGGVGWIFDPEVSISVIQEGLKGYSNAYDILEKLKELTNKFALS